MQHDAIPMASILREIIERDKQVQLTVLTNSMTPILDKADIIGLEPVSSENLRLGRIVTFEERAAPHRIITHRVAAAWHDDMGDLHIVTRGDQMPYFDDPVLKDAVIGVVTWRSRRGRKLRLDRGSGAWLDRQLGKLSEGVRAQISGLPLNVGASPAEFLVQANKQSMARRNSRRAVLARAAARPIAALLAGLGFVAAVKED
jgi:signal peptidase I